MADVARLLGETRMVTLTGSGGAGKTRLAVRGRGSTDDSSFPDGTWLVELTPITHAGVVPIAVAARWASRSAGPLD